MALRVRCPELQSALSDLGIDALLLQGWQDRLTPHGLSDIAELVTTYDAMPARALPDTQALQGILKTLNREPGGAGRSWWDRFTSWLRDWLEHSNSLVAVWLRKLFEGASVSHGVLKLLGYGLASLLAVAAVIAVVLEIKASRGPHRPKFAEAARPAAAPETAMVANWVPPSAADELSNLLRRLVQRLLQTGRLKVERSLTHRELIARSQLDDDTQRRVFAVVAAAAESALYGPQRGIPQLPPEVLEQGRQLLQQLQQSET